ncbi:MAG TPA: hemerythrin domain-containing protein [Trebonia sp.]|nr:hemerythrin domain-containing protein [Trebonia sp.]
MPDVFEVLREDHDEVKAMLAQLEEGPTASAGATDEQLAFRGRAVDAVIIEESRHEAVEQQYFWPAVQRLGPDGTRVADEGLGQEERAEQILADLHKLQPGDAEFEGRLRAFTADARAHIAFEEAQAWPLLRASISAEEAAALGEQVSKAKKLAPTRPHPAVPAQPGAATSAGPLAGIADRLRDTLTGRGKTSS